MKSLQSAARRGLVISATALSALALASCSAGQITQTSDKVIAVDGSSAKTEDGNIAVQDVTILLEPETGEAALKFTAVNAGYGKDKVTLEAIDVDGQAVELGAIKPFGRDESIVGNSAANLKALPESDLESIQYVATTLENDDFGYAGTRPVTFTFSNGSVVLNAPVSASPLQSGKFNRDATSPEGYTTEQPKAGH